LLPWYDHNWIMHRTALRRFFFPRVTRRYILRLLLVAVAAWVIFKYLLIPVRIRGISMEPTYRDGGVNVCWRLRYAFSDPRPGDLVAVRFSGRSLMMLKRVVAVAGDKVAFRGGVLYVNGKAVNEPYVVYPCHWNLSPRRVRPGHVYIVGDNRSVPMGEHNFGQTTTDRIMGAPLW